MTRDLEQRLKEAEHRARVAELHWEEATANAIRIQEQLDKLVLIVKAAPRRRITTKSGREVEVCFVPVSKLAGMTD